MEQGVKKKKKKKINTKYMLGVVACAWRVKSGAGSPYTLILLELSNKFILNSNIINDEIIS